jgi:glycosyltransferase involved in cell wall biosynthesis
VGYRILAINWQDIENPQAGGAEVHITEILSRLVKQGHQATLFCSGFEGASPETIQQGIRIIRRGSRFNFNWVLPFLLRPVLRENQFHIVLEDLNKMPFFSPLLHRLPTLVIIHHFFGKSIFRETNPLFGLYVLLGEALVPIYYRHFPFLTISDSSKLELIHRGVREETITVVNNGITDLFYSSGADYEKSKVPSVLYLGRIKKYKGVQDLLQAIAIVRDRMPQVELKIVGSGDYLPALKRLANDLSLANNVTFTGFVT